MSLQEKQSVGTILMKCFFLIFLHRQSGIIALSIKVIEHSSEEHQQFAVIYTFVYTHIHNFLK